jgi:hypothetical protein
MDFSGSEVISFAWTSIACILSMLTPVSEVSDIMDSWFTLAGEGMNARVLRLLTEVTVVL